MTASSMFINYHTTPMIPQQQQHVWMLDNHHDESHKTVTEDTSKLPFFQTDGDVSKKQRSNTVHEKTTTAAKPFSNKKRKVQEQRHKKKSSAATRTTTTRTTTSEAARKNGWVDAKQILGADYIPGPYDVICARGKQAWNHASNKRFRERVKLYESKYASLSTKA